MGVLMSIELESTRRAPRTRAPSEPDVVTTSQDEEKPAPPPVLWVLIPIVLVVVALVLAR